MQLGGSPLSASVKKRCGLDIHAISKCDARFVDVADAPLSKLINRTLALQAGSGCARVAIARFLSG
jgi:hypothetical protein